MGMTTWLFLTPLVEPIASGLGSKSGVSPQESRLSIGRVAGRRIHGQTFGRVDPLRTASKWAVSWSRGHDGRKRHHEKHCTTLAWLAGYVRLRCHLPAPSLERHGINGCRLRFSASCNPLHTWTSPYCRQYIRRHGLRSLPSYLLPSNPSNPSSSSSQHYSSCTASRWLRTM